MSPMQSLARKKNEFLKYSEFRITVCGVVCWVIV